MKKLQLILSALGCLVITGAIAQQDVHYSQFYTAPTYLNPATAGAFNGDIRAFANYRTQWKSVMMNPFTTLTASVDAPIRPKSGNNHFGVGMSFFNDKAGDGSYTTNDYNLNFSYVIEVARNSYFSLGLGVGLMQRGINFQSLYWDNQWNGQTFDQGAYSGETGFTDNFMVFDLSGGVNYYAGFDDGTRLSFGVAGAHLNRPNISFLALEDDFLMKYTAHGGMEWPIPNSNMRLVPNVLLVFQGPNQIINFGSDFKYMIQGASKALSFVDEISMSVGTYYRLGDAAYFTARFNYAGLSVGAAYDLTVSDLSTYNGGSGAMEFFVSYTAHFGNTGGISSFR